MKRLLIFSFLSIFAASASGCFNCCQPRKPQACRPACAPAPAAACCSPGTEFATPGIITTAPTLSVPQNYAPAVVPGPAAYVPAQ